MRKLAANLLALDGVSPIHRSVPPPRRRFGDLAEDAFARQSATLHARDAEDRRRIVLATIVVCVGVFVAGVALWQAQNARTVYVPIPSEYDAPPKTVATAAAPAPVSVYDAPTTTVSFAPAVSAQPSTTVAAPAMPLTWTPAPAFAAPTPVDYAARDRQIADLKRRIEDIDETIRRVRADPHWFGMIKGSTYTANQQASDAYLANLDKQRNDLRRQKWAVEGR